MPNALLSELSPLSFLQMFVTQSVKLAGQPPQQDAACHSHIQILGLTASSCLEAPARQQLGPSGGISRAQYAALVVSIKNPIGITPRAVHQKLRGYGIEAAAYRKPGR